jgi:hypothetical protein
MSQRKSASLLILILSFLFLNISKPANVNKVTSAKYQIAELIRNHDSQNSHIQIGDMLLKVKDLQDFYESESAIGLYQRPWTDGKVYYSFDSLITETTKEMFFRAFREWESGTPLQFIEHTREQNYIYIIYSEITSSAIGMGEGKQLLKITPYWHTPYGTVLHEIGHALGLHHEHQRTDRDLYVEIMEENLLHLGESQILLIMPTINYTPYDFLSVMHYGRFTLSKNGKETIHVRKEYSLFLNKIGNRQSLSTLDLEGLRKLYSYMPALIYPDKNELNVPADKCTFSWSDFPDATEFHIQIAEDQLFQKVVKDEIQKSTNLESDVILKQSTQFKNLKPNSNYFWRVRCMINDTHRSWSDTVSFRTEVNNYTHYSQDPVNKIILKQNYPNPFNSGTTITFELDEPVNASLRLFDSAGKQVAKPVSGFLLPGKYEVQWNSNNLASGLYYYQLHAGGKTITRKMVLVK